MDLGRRLSQAFLETHPDDAALLLEGLPAAEVTALVEQAPLAPLSRVVERMVPSSSTECLARLSPKRAAALLSLLPLDTSARLLRQMPEPTREQQLAAVPDDLAGTLRLLLRYPEHTAGALMDPTALTLPGDITTNEARARVRRSAQRVLYYLYVVDRDHTLVGVLTLRELLLATGKEPLTTVLQPQVARLGVQSDRAAILAHPGWRDFHALPVVDERNVFLGALRYETLRHLEGDPAAARQHPSSLGVALALVELYWIGVARLLETLRSPAAPSSSPQRERRDSDGI